MDVRSRFALTSVALVATVFFGASRNAFAQDCVPTSRYDQYWNSCCPSGCENWWESSSMTGNLFGAGTAMAEHGIVAGLSLTQFYQGVASGGAEQTFRYGGKGDYNFTFLGEPLGLNKGFTLIMHAESRYGQDSIFDAAGLAPVNGNMLYPSLENETAITGFQFLQALSEDYAVTFGKFNAFDLINTLYPQTGRGLDGFMNASMLLPLTAARTVPLSFMGAGVIKLHEGQFQGGLIVYDNQNVATTSGFDDMFNNGASVLGFYRFFTEMNGLPGSHLFLGTWSEGTYTSLDATDWAFLPPVAVIPGENTGTWQAAYIYDQQLWVDAHDENRHVGFLTMWGLADQTTSPYAWTANVALQGQGLIPGRPQDTAGIGYFYSGLSSDLQNLVSPVLPIDDLQGGEIYYNAAVTNWFHLTLDLQAVEPGIEANDPAVVVGLRGKIDL